MRIPFLRVLSSLFVLVLIVGAVAAQQGQPQKTTARNPPRQMFLPEKVSARIFNSRTDVSPVTTVSQPQRARTFRSEPTGKQA